MPSRPVTKPYEQNITTRWFSTPKTGQEMEKTPQHLPPNKKNHIHCTTRSTLASTPHPKQYTKPQHTNIPHPPITTAPPTEWINTIANIAKNANKEAKKITTKYTKDCILKAVSKYTQMYEKNPKKINRKINQKVFKNTETSPLDFIIDRQNNILTNPEDIASEIYIQQSISNRPTVLTCHYQNTHPLHCTCGV